MYEGWHVEFTDHARRRLSERAIEEKEVQDAISHPDAIRPNTRRGGKLLSRYLKEWDRILIVSVEEFEDEGILLVKTVLWSAVE